jgi:hypothetical protein
MPPHGDLSGRMGAVSQEMTSTRAAPARVAPRLALALYLVAALLAALATFGVFNPGGYVVVAGLFDHPILFGVLVFALLGLACRVGPGPTWLRTMGFALAAVAAAGWASLGVLYLLVALVTPHGQVASERSPTGSLEFQVTEGAAMIDPVWELRVRRHAGLLSRQWSAGCLNGDDDNNSFRKAKWTGPESVAVTVGDGRVLQLHLDPATGRPLRSLVTGAGC